MPADTSTTTSPTPERDPGEAASPTPTPGFARRAARILGRVLGWTARMALRLFWWGFVIAVAWRTRPWELDLAAHFAPHAAALGLGLALSLLPWRRTRRLGLEGLVAALALWAIVIRDHTVNWRWSEEPPSGARLRLVTHNTDAWKSSRDFPFYHWLREQDADIVVIIDPPPNIDGEANWLLDEYPHRHAPQPGFKWAIKIYSRFPMEITPLATPGPEVMFSFAAHRARTVTLPDGSRFLLSAMHPVSPRERASIGRAEATVRLDGRLIRQWHEATGQPAILAGDFNSTPTGRVFQTLASASGMKTYSSILRRGTWPRWAPTWLGVPIDRVWVTPGASIDRAEVGPAFASGHRPVVVDLTLPAPRASE